MTPRGVHVAQLDGVRVVWRIAAACARSNEASDSHAERRERKARKRREFQADNRRSVRVLQRVMRRRKPKRSKR